MMLDLLFILLERFSFPPPPFSALDSGSIFGAVLSEGECDGSGKVEAGVGGWEWGWGSSVGVIAGGHIFFKCLQMFTNVFKKFKCLS